MLDDLHNYFPELLYRPERFRTVPDLLGYVQQQTRSHFNLLDRGYQMFNNHIYSTMYANNTNTIVEPSEERRNTPAGWSHPPTERRPPTDERRPPPVERQPSLPTVERRTPTVERQPSLPTVERQPPLTIPLMERHNDLSGQTVPSTPLRHRSNRMSILIPPARSIPLYDHTPPLFQTTFDSRGLTTLDTGGLATLVSALFGAENLMEPVYVTPSSEDISANTTTTHLSITSSENCAICQEAMRADEHVRTINQCWHTFHTSCIDEWFRTSVRCPNCRLDIRTAAHTSRPRDE